MGGPRVAWLHLRVNFPGHSREFFLPAKNRPPHFSPGASEVNEGAERGVSLSISEIPATCRVGRVPRGPPGSSSPDAGRVVRPLIVDLRRLGRPGSSRDRARWASRNSAHPTPSKTRSRELHPGSRAGPAGAPDPLDRTGGRALAWLPSSDGCVPARPSFIFSRLLETLYDRTTRRRMPPAEGRGRRAGDGRGRHAPAPEPWTPRRVFEWNSYYDIYVAGFVLLLAFLGAVNRIGPLNSSLWSLLEAGRRIAATGTPGDGLDTASIAGEGLRWTNIPWLFELIRLQALRAVALSSLTPTTELGTNPALVSVRPGRAAGRRGPHRPLGPGPAGDRRATARAPAEGAGALVDGALRDAGAGRGLQPRRSTETISVPANAGGEADQGHPSPAIATSPRRRSPARRQVAPGRPGA